MNVKPGILFRHPHASVIHREIFTPESGNLQFLACGEYEIVPGAQTCGVTYPREEALLFLWQGSACVQLCRRTYALAPYDLLYVPAGEAHKISNAGPETARLWVTRAPAENIYPPFHAEFAKVSKDESRIRRLTGKDVYLMFGAAESADKLVAGYSFFQPFSRSWPPHNHADQEEVYIFLKGHGSMEVYESPETLTFAHEVREEDVVAIPVLNYHPVFTQESPLEFLWCIAGERYWVGDRNPDFFRSAAG